MISSLPNPPPSLHTPPSPTSPAIVSLSLPTLLPPKVFFAPTFFSPCAACPHPISSCLLLFHSSSSPLASLFLPPAPHLSQTPHPSASLEALSPVSQGRDYRHTSPHQFPTLLMPSVCAHAVMAIWCHPWEGAAKEERSRGEGESRSQRLRMEWGVRSNMPLLFIPRFSIIQTRNVTLVHYFL